MNGSKHCHTPIARVGIQKTLNGKQNQQEERMDGTQQPISERRDGTQEPNTQQQRHRSVQQFGWELLMFDASEQSSGKRVGIEETRKMRGRTANELRLSQTRNESAQREGERK